MRSWIPLAILPAWPCALGSLSPSEMRQEVHDIERQRCESCWDAERQALYGGCEVYASDVAGWVDAAQEACAIYDANAAQDCVDELRARMETCTGDDLDEPLGCEEAFEDCAVPTGTLPDSPAR